MEKNKGNIIMIRLNTKEQCVLEKMMAEDEWENMAGFIKYSLFKKQENIIYKKMLEGRNRQDKKTKGKYIR